MATEVPAYPGEERAAKTVVAVTGCTGFVAGSVVQRLLRLGHVVHGTCRDPSKAKALMELPGAADRLKLFKADLLDEGSFDEAFAGCELVVHCASPYVTSLPANQVQEKLVKPAIQGTKNVLGSVNKVAKIKRVVLTSSCASVYGSPVERGVGHVFTEDDWSLVPTESVLPYYYSKREAEKAAWAIAEQQSRWNLVVINPPVILGPPMTPRSDGESITLFREIFAGKMFPACPNLGMGYVDVRDVAAAHTLALFSPNAKGRYICCANSSTLAQLIKQLAELYPKKVWVPLMAPPKLLLWLLGPLLGLRRDMVTHCVGLPPPQFSSDKIKRELGFRFLDTKTSLKDMADAMSQLGLLPKLD